MLFVRETKYIWRPRRSGLLPTEPSTKRFSLHKLLQNLINSGVVKIIILFSFSYTYNFHQNLHNKLIKQVVLQVVLVAIHS